MSHLLGQVGVAVVAFLGFELFNKNIFTYGKVNGRSMEPTLSSGSVICARLWNYKPKKGDIAILNEPTDDEQPIVKRITGMPGDIKTYERWKKGTGSETITTVVPPGHVFVEGDNPSNSYDSRSYGPVPMALVLGKVVFQVWPSRIQK